MCDKQGYRTAISEKCFPEISHQEEQRGYIQGSGISRHLRFRRISMGSFLRSRSLVDSAIPVCKTAERKNAILFPEGITPMNSEDRAALLKWVQEKREWELNHSCAMKNKDLPG